MNSANDSASFAVSGSCSEASQAVSIQVDGANSGSGGSCDGTSFSATIDTTLLTQGSHTLTASISDASGNSATSANITIIKDTSAPSIAITSPAINSYVNLANDSASFAVSGSCSEASQAVSIQVDGANSGSGGSCNGTSFSATIDTTLLNQGSRTLTASIFDASGNSATSADITIIKDTSTPSIAITSPANNTTISGSSNSATYTISGSCSEASQAVSIQVDGANSGSGGSCNGTSFSATIDTTLLWEGNHNLTAKISDLAGNLVTSASVTINRVIGPVITIPTSIVSGINREIQIPITLSESWPSEISFQVTTSTGTAIDYEDYLPEIKTVSLHSAPDRCVTGATTAWPAGQLPT